MFRIVDKILESESSKGLHGNKTTHTTTYAQSNKY